MSRQATETEPLLSSQREEAGAIGALSPVLWLFPAVILASTSRGISMFARYDYYQDMFCSGAPYPCGFFAEWIKLPGLTLQMQMWPMFASFVVSFMTIGWWSTFGDRRGRKPVLFASLFGAMLLDLSYLIIANIQLLRENAQDCVSIGLMIDGLLGGFATYNGVVYAYASDVSHSSVYRTVFFCVLQTVSFLSFRIGAAFGLLSSSVMSHSNLSYILSVTIALLNLLYIFFLLPESLTSQQRERYNLAPDTQSTALKSILSPFSVFLRGSTSRKHLPLFALSIYIYTLTSGLDVAMLIHTTLRGYFPSLPRWLLLIIPSILKVATLLGIIPTLAWMFMKSYGDTEKSGLLFAKSVAQNSILIGALSTLGILVFGGPKSSILFDAFFWLYSFSAGALPALYSLAASYFVALNRGQEIGSLFGALSIWGSLAQIVSHVVLRGERYFEVYWFASFLLVTSVIFLVPDGPPPPTEASDGGVGSAEESA
ncbi:hypothetical protein B0H10DRAFT_1395791 [Mycena sp. CBHHK59/15]|nr:hypothetical protein B0H10DRAFT_1395791 [Mycena sp. CBHHK59/15]